MSGAIRSASSVKLEVRSTAPSVVASPGAHLGLCLLLSGVIVATTGHLTNIIGHLTSRHLLSTLPSALAVIPRSLKPSVRSSGCRQMPHASFMVIADQSSAHKVLSRVFRLLVQTMRTRSDRGATLRGWAMHRGTALKLRLGTLYSPAGGACASVVAASAHVVSSSSVRDFWARAGFTHLPPERPWRLCEADRGAQAC